MSKWISHVKKWANDNNVKYSCALADPEMRNDYYKSNNLEVPMKTVKQSKTRKPRKTLEEYENEKIGKMLMRRSQIPPEQYKEEYAAAQRNEQRKIFEKKFKAQLKKIREEQKKLPTKKTPRLTKSSKVKDLLQNKLEMDKLLLPIKEPTKKKLKGIKPVGLLTDDQSKQLEEFENSLVENRFAKVDSLLSKADALIQKSLQRKAAASAK